jgi:hypothetical protein
VGSQGALVETSVPFSPQVSTEDFSRNKNNPFCIIININQQMQASNSDNKDSLVPLYPVMAYQFAPTNGTNGKKFFLTNTNPQLMYL